MTALAAPAATRAPAAPPTDPVPPAVEPAHRRAARYAWALLLARIYEGFPLLCPKCGGEMRIIAFITDAPTVRDLLTHLGEPITPPTIAPARGPPRWEEAAAALIDAIPPEDASAPPQPAFEFDQRIAW